MARKTRPKLYRYSLHANVSWQIHKMLMATAANGRESCWQRHRVVGRLQKSTLHIRGPSTAVWSLVHLVHGPPNCCRLPCYASWRRSEGRLSSNLPISRDSTRSNIWRLCLWDRRNQCELSTGVLQQIRVFPRCNAWLQSHLLRAVLQSPLVCICSD